ncbi:TetR family transcriptional regulator [Deinococcus aestuarii]|uniref:TetR family transcriptional regulator n=1 Tax=Deinococcus aestuarii TaxID=2774531 RepID=UPI001FE34709|nr:TetR family transcriptional regulator [Deinococcus aestuarii]
MYIERGYERTTVAQIAGRAGLTERTFFRYFADKREVLFGGAAALQDLIVDAIVSAPEACAPIEAVAVGLEAVGTVFQENVERSRRRQTVILANAELQARELSKLAALTSGMKGALRRRGVKDPTASLTAEAGMVVFRVAFDRWINATHPQDWSRLVRESLGGLRTVMVGDETRVAAQP